jgi:hypothetical protein
MSSLFTAVLTTERGLKCEVQNETDIGFWPDVQLSKRPESTQSMLGKILHPPPLPRLAKYDWGCLGSFARRL